MKTIAENNRVFVVAERELAGISYWLVLVRHATGDGHVRTAMSQAGAERILAEERRRYQRETVDEARNRLVARYS